MKELMQAGNPALEPVALDEPVGVVAVAGHASLAASVPPPWAQLMSSRFSNAVAQYAEVSGFNMLRGSLLQFWYRLPTWVRAIYWLEILAALAVLSLLLAFHQVVQGVVVQADLRREVIATHAEATWRCNALQELRASQSCLLQLKASTLAEAMLPGLATPSNQRPD